MKIQVLSCGSNYSFSITIKSCPLGAISIWTGRRTQIVAESRTGPVRWSDWIILLRDSDRLADSHNFLLTP